MAAEIHKPFLTVKELEGVLNEQNWLRQNGVNMHLSTLVRVKFPELYINSNFPLTRKGKNGLSR